LPASREELSAVASEPLYVEVAVFSPLTRAFTYLWPESLGVAQCGIRVQVPLGSSRRMGIVLRISLHPPGGIKMKSILDRWDENPLYSESRLRWLDRARRYYLAAPGEMFETAFAWARGDDRQRWHCPDVESLAEQDSDIAGAFSKRTTLSTGTLSKHGFTNLHHRLSVAQTSGLIHPVESLAERKTAVEFAEEPVPDRLFPAQDRAIDEILSAGSFASFLLFGPTGSGKTEVYLRAAIQKIQNGGQVLIMVPEIGLTPQWLARLQARLPDVAVWHSELTLRERSHVRFHLNDIKVLIGTRSAIFLPLPRLSLVIVDEEQDGSFKQGDGVRYSARDLAVLLAQELDIPIVMGSATPSMESWRQAMSGNYRILTLDRRVSPAPPLTRKIVDMRGVDTPLSDFLTRAIEDTRVAGSQTLLYLNRRGYAPALICSACGQVPECLNCSLRLTLHRRQKQLRCHACGFSRSVPRSCDQCGEDALLPLGEGTEKVEEQLRKVLPDLRFTCMDRDSVHCGQKRNEILQAFANGSLDCLIGTQMLIKGHHFPNVTLVGVVNADQGLSLPDFRAAEHWWQQLTQVLGRAGRGSRPGHIIIQSRNPEMPWLNCIGDEQARDFMEREARLRKELEFPPFARWVRLVFSSRKRGRAEASARSAANLFTAQGIDGITGPMLCPVERLEGRYRFELIIKDSSRRVLPWKLAPLLEELPLDTGVRRSVDVDPVEMT